MSEAVLAFTIVEYAGLKARSTAERAVRPSRISSYKCPK